MERFQGQINPFFSDARSMEVEGLAEAKSLAFKEENLQDKVPFLKMLQSEVEDTTSSPFLSIKEPNFLALLSFQNLKETSWELENYLSQEDHHHHPHFHSRVNSETNRQESPFSRAKKMKMIPSSSSSSAAKSRRKTRKISSLLPQEMTREKRKRKKTKPTKNIEEIENQRMNHIAVERNRRRQMNEHINSLRSLLPPSYIQRVDQASIVGGAINYVKILEQIIQSLELQKRKKQSREGENANNSNNHHSGISSNNLWATTTNHEEDIPKIEATVIQNYVSLKVECRKKQGQLLKGIISLEKLRLTVLHLNIASSSHSSVSYSFNLKMEDDCDLESADDITKVAHQIFDIR